MKHKWGEPSRPDLNSTFRTCSRCGTVKVTRHEHENDPPHWTEWIMNGDRFVSDKTPACGDQPKEDDIMAAKPKAAAKAAPAQTDHPYRLVEMRAENFKKLRMVSVAPDGAVLKVHGRNEQGKSSLLDAFMAAVGGKDYFPPKPIRDGSRRAEVFVDFGGLKLTRRMWLKEDDSLAHDVKIEFADGQTSSKQSVLDVLRGSPIAVDPLEFSRMKPKERLDLLKQLVPDVDFDDLAKQRKALVDSRAQVGREYERAKGAAESISVPANTPRDLVDVSALSAELAGISKHNDDIAARVRRREEAEESIDKMLDQADALEREAKSARAAAADLQKKLKEAGPLPEPKDADVIAAKIDGAEAINAAVRLRKTREERVKERDDREVEYDGMTKQIEALDDKKTKAIASAKLPVPNLMFGDDDIMLEGLPFEQASTARKIRVSTALIMALKPDLRVMLVREGSLLDDDAKRALEEDAAAKGFVVFMECVGAGDGTGVVIEDGEVA